jgi:hypothetical protein
MDRWQREAIGRQAVDQFRNRFGVQEYVAASRRSWVTTFLEAPRRWSLRWLLPTSIQGSTQSAQSEAHGPLRHVGCGSDKLPPMEDSGVKWNSTSTPACINRLA